MILGTAGHIDHGKTTLVRALTGVDTDRLPEEKRRGITIDLGFAPLTLEGVGVLGVVDVPGHEAFVRTMVAGAAGIDLAMLVIAADAGVMPQTREHLAILGILGVTRGVVALTKCDLVDEDWLALVEEDVRDVLEGTPLATARIVRVSATNGTGIAALVEALRDAARDVAARSKGDHFRLPVDRVFTVKGTGTVVTGTVWSGALERDASVSLHPTERTLRVRGLQAHGHAVDEVQAGERAAIALTGVELEELHRGMVLTRGEGWIGTRVLRADVTLLPAVGIAPSPRQWLRLHLGTQEVGARVVTHAALEAGTAMAARVVLDAPVVARGGDRFVLRAASPAMTIGGGVVTDPHAPVRARPWPVANTSAEQRLALMLADAGAEGVATVTVPVRLGVDSSSVTSLLAAVGAWVVGTRAIARSHREALRVAAESEVRGYHAAHPLEPGVPTQWLRSRLQAPDDVATAVIDALVGAGQLRAHQGLVSDVSFTSSLSESQATLSSSLLDAIRGSGHEPPSLDELAQQMKLSRGQISDVARWLVREGALVAVEPDRYYSQEAVRQLRARLAEGMEGTREYAPSELRELLGLTRKFLIPFLEYCDREGYTIRGGLGRRLAAPSEGPRVR